MRRYWEYSETKIRPMYSFNTSIFSSTYKLILMNKQEIKKPFYFIPKKIKRNKRKN